MSKKYRALRVVGQLTFPHYVIEEKDVETDDSGRHFLREGIPKYRVCLGGMEFSPTDSLDAALAEVARLNDLYEQHFQPPEYFTWTYEWIEVVGASAIVTSEHFQAEDGRLRIRKTYESIINGVRAPADSLHGARDAITAEEARLEKARLEKIEREKADRLQIRPPRR